MGAKCNDGIAGSGPHLMARCVTLQRGHKDASVILQHGHKEASAAR